MTLRPAFWLVAAGVVVADQATKQWTLSALEEGERVPVIGDLLSIQLVFNSGAAFSVGDERTWILTIVALVLTAGIAWYARRANGRIPLLIFALGLGGAIGNLIDRLFRQPSFGEGHVVDMINYADFFVGNVADIAIVGAAAWGVLYAMTRGSLLKPDPAPEAVAEEPSESA
ncbi:signal peptidase II [Demequina sp. NBRC 110052]|uniref:signal peptidase II n=1 Tax=Demequina sp. NBRC 110052 TaxID=1570341 RepID=UPI00190EB442|nr:signal peptidase II [Demequina sp. NBRC 110052]